MGINVFLSSLLAISVGVYFIPVENVVKITDNKDIPLVVFEEPLMYTLDESSVSRVVQSSHAVRYENRDEMINANVILKNKDPKKKFDAENLKAEIIIKKGDIFTLKKGVEYKRDDFIDLTTDELFYNLDTKVAYNEVPYEGNYFDHYIKGKKLYLDANKNSMKSKDVHFEIDMKNKK